MITKNEIRFARLFMFLFLSYATSWFFLWHGDNREKYLGSNSGPIIGLSLFVLLTIYASLLVCYGNITQSKLKSFCISCPAIIISFAVMWCCQYFYSPPKGSGIFAGLAFEFLLLFYLFLGAIILIIPMCFGVAFVLRSLGARLQNKWLSEEIA